MAVKRSRSAGRMLSVFEAVAAMQPIGVSALARQLGADKSAVQRDLMTLADAGWIRAAPGVSGQWELTPHILTLAHPPHSSDSLRQRARPVLERLRAETGETAYLTVPDGERFVVLDAAESRHVLRMVPPVGMIVPLEGSATGRVILSWLPGEERERLLGEPLSAAMLQELEVVRGQGYAVSDGDIVSGAVAIAAPIMDAQGAPAGSLVLTGPGERLVPERRVGIGEKLCAAARELSQAAG